MNLKVIINNKYKHFQYQFMVNYSYDPNMSVPRKIMSYYINYYQTFVDSTGPASVNISSATIKQINIV
ncbi:hypothetical protein U3516DRAFT_734810 [Neocallimastix sp. 'constans']